MICNQNPVPRKAMILAAGLGTRLRPLTEQVPKALMPVANVPLIARAVDYLKGYGITDIVVNVHHLAADLIAFLDGGRPFGVKVAVRHEPVILGTGGGLRNTADFWDAAPFCVLNADILTDLDLRAAFAAHDASGALATLILHDAEPFNKIRVDAAGRVLEIPVPYLPDIPGRLAFTGVQIMDPRVLAYIPEGVFSDVMDCYRLRIQAGDLIAAHVSKGHSWRDVGTRASYLAANREALGRARFDLGVDCRVEGGAELADWAVMGPGTVLESGCRVEASVLWAGARVKPGVRVVRSVISRNRIVTEDCIDGVL